VSSCTEFIELISAYADGELTGSDKQRLKEHLGVCENCSAILDLYREISVAAEESGAPVPDALRDGVMEKVLLEDAHGAGDTGKNRKVIRMVLTRYVPIAACLAVALITLPNVMNNSGGQDSYGNVAPMEAGAPETAAPAAPAPAATPVPDMAFDTYLEEAEADEEAISRVRLYDENDNGVAPGGAPDPDPGEIFAEMIDLSIIFDQPEAMMEASDLDVAPPAEMVGTDEPQSEPEPAVEQPARREPFAYIRITVEIPEEFLAQAFEYSGTEIRPGMSMEITREQAEQFIALIQEHDLQRQGLSFIYGDKDSDHALVMYSPGG